MALLGKNLTKNLWFDSRWGCDHGGSMKSEIWFVNGARGKTTLFNLLGI